MSVSKGVKKAFSLIELMIVIVIIGVIYTLAVSKLQNVGAQKPVPSLKNLKEYLFTYVKEETKEVKLLCLGACESCDVYVDDVKQEKKIEPFFDDSIEVYKYDFSQGTRKVQDAVFFNEEGRQEDVCFSFTMSRNSISEQVLIVFKEKAYDYTSYFTPTKVYDHLEELLESKEIVVQEVAR
ncbi:prepilin-type N-terminal cleavage/methylation domain-containing protein [Sulfurimonas sp. SAG-AH-194-C20]|nr:prepilin-type N-terminal cleavage/methylation domain-containing protein [Sulfurimonas sp. SAG-AH-194-C20]MDF1878175.1 prepilin-type N-terminal cleavage/methylation domain-containing protein [Sulfurimonas sp. SAG-AH-194-C20]